MKILIIGLGNMGFAIAKSLKESKASFNIEAYDPLTKFTDKAKKSGIPLYNTPSKISQKTPYDVLLLAVKPTIIRSTLDEIKPLIQNSVTLVSIAAGVSTKILSEHIGDAKTPYPHVVRYMPTIAAQVKESITAISPGKGATKKDIKKAQLIAESFGQSIEIPEPLMDAFTGVAGSGIAFAAAFIEALTLAGVREGLSYDQAYKSTQQTIQGALALLDTTSKKPVFSSPSQMITAISSPGGTTIAGIHTIHEQGMYAAVLNAVHKAAARSQEIQKSLKA